MGQPGAMSVPRRSEDIVFPRLLQRRAEGPAGGDPFVKLVGGAWRSFADVHQDSLAWAGRLSAAGVRAGDRVAVMVPTSIESVSLWSAVGQLGSIEVPVHTELRGSMLAHVLNDSGAKVLVLSQPFLDRIDIVAPQLTELETILVTHEAGTTSQAPQGWGGTVLPASTAAVDPAPSAAAGEYWDPAAILYTSGTTGPAKGVILPWAQFAAGITGLFPDVDRDDCFYTPLPLHHIAGRGTVYRSVASGGRVLLRERFSVADYWRDVRGDGCTTTILMGAMADMLWQVGPAADDGDNPLDKVLMTPLIPQVHEFAERFGVRIRTNFGMTEIGGPIVGGVDRPLVDTRSCGRPRPGYECRVVDEHDEPVAPGELGELVVRTERPWMIMSGYWNDPAKTAASWRNQWFHTGDAFTVDEDGNHYFVDRVKDAIRRSGENISSFHLEQELNAHPDVEESAVVGVSSGATEQEVRAFVVVRAGSEFRPRDLVEFLEPRVARFMVPRYWTPIEELPKTPTLRVRKAELRALDIGPETWDRRAARAEVAR